MSKTVLSKVEGFTPLIDILVEGIGAAVRDLTNIPKLV